MMGLFKRTPVQVPPLRLRLYEPSEFPTNVHITQHAIERFLKRQPKKPKLEVTSPASYLRELGMTGEVFGPQTIVRSDYYDSMAVTFYRRNELFVGVMCAPVHNGVVGAEARMVTCYLRKEWCDERGRVSRGTGDYDREPRPDAASRTRRYR